MEALAPTTTATVNKTSATPAHFKRVSALYLPLLSLSVRCAMPSTVTTVEQIVVIHHSLPHMGETSVTAKR